MHECMYECTTVVIGAFQKKSPRPKQESSLSSLIQESLQH